MGNELLSSKVIVEREAPALLAITGVPTSSVGMVGVCQWGPIGDATLITSFKEFKDKFGDFMSAHHLPASVYMALKSPKGAKRIWITRVTEFTDPDDPTTTTALKADVDILTGAVTQGAVTSGNAGPFNLEHGEDLVLHCDEDGGGPDTATFNGTPSLIAGGAWAGGLLAADQLTFKTDTDPDNQVIVFAGGETFQDTIDLLNTVNGLQAIDSGGGGTNIDLQSDTDGTDGSIQIVSESPAGVAAKIGHATGAAVIGGGNVGNIDAVTFAEAKSIIEAAVVNPVTGVLVTEEGTGEITITSQKVGGGPTSSIQVEVASTATGFGFDNLLHQGGAGTTVTMTAEGKYYGDMINSWVVRIAAATSGEVDRFNLILLDDAGAIKETWPNLIQGSAQTTDPRYVETIINDPVTGSKYLAVTDDLGSDGRPTDGDYTLTGGDAGIAGIADPDFLGLAGLGAFAWAEEFIAIKAIPGKTSAAINQALVADAESVGNFAVLDPPSGLDTSGIVTYVKTTASLYQLSEYSSIFWPWVKVPNPDDSVYGRDVADVELPPCGAIIAAILNNDARTGGVHEAAAGLELGKLWGVTGVAHRDALNEDKRDVVDPALVNVITRLARGGPFFNDGHNVLLTTGPFPSLGESRGVIFIEQSVKNGTEWVRHRNIVQRLFNRIKSGITVFLVREMKKDAFVTRDPATAFYVDVSPQLNPPSEQFAEKLNIRIGLAKAKPAKFVIITITQDIRLLQEELGLD